MIPQFRNRKYLPNYSKESYEYITTQIELVNSSLFDKRNSLRAQWISQLQSDDINIKFHTLQNLYFSYRFDLSLDHAEADREAVRYLKMLCNLDLSKAKISKQELKSVVAACLELSNLYAFGFPQGCDDIIDFFQAKIYCQSAIDYCEKHNLKKLGIHANLQMANILVESKEYLEAEKLYKQINIENLQVTYPDDEYLETVLKSAHSFLSKFGDLKSIPVHMHKEITFNRDRSKVKVPPPVTLYDRVNRQKLPPAYDSVSQNSVSVSIGSTESEETAMQKFKRSAIPSLTEVEEMDEQPSPAVSSSNPTIVSPVHNRGDRG